MANAAREQGARSWQFKLAFVWGGELISTLTSSILQMGFIWHITLSTNSANMLSLASLAGFLPLALFGMFAGAIVDRLPLKRVLIGSDLFAAACALAFQAASVLLRFNGMDDMAATTDILMGACYVACMVLLVVVMVKASKR